MKSPDFTDSTRQIQRLQRVIECTKLLNSTLEIAEWTKIVLQIMRDEVAVERCTVFVIDRERKTLRSIIAQGAGTTEISLPIGSGLAGAVAENGDTVDIPNAYEDPRFNAEFDRNLGYQTRDVFCMPILNPDGTLVGVLQLLNRTRPLTGEDHDFLHSISVHIGLALERAWLYREILEKRKIEQESILIREQLAQLEKLSLMGELIAGVVHEVRNPLSILFGHCALLRQKLSADPAIVDSIDKIEASGRKALSVAQNFLNFARKPSGERETANLNDVVQKTLDLISYELKVNEIEIVKSFGEIPPVEIDAGQLQQVLLNLFKNAKDAMSEHSQGGQLTVRSGYDERTNFVFVDVSDTGPGIDEESQLRIFEPFYTTKAGGLGTGLGLSISRRIMENHGGQVRFRSEPGHGATFRIALPAPKGKL